MTRQLDRISFGVFIAFVVFLLITSNNAFFDPSAVFTQDFAQSSIVTFDASRLHRVYGVPSWTSFHHPGAILHYWRAIFEVFGGLFAISNIAMTLISLVSLIIFSCILTAFILTSWADIDRGIALGISALIVGTFSQNMYYLVSIWEPVIVIHSVPPFLAAVVATTNEDARKAVLGLAGTLIGALIIMQQQVPMAFMAFSFATIALLSVGIIHGRGAYRALTAVPVSAKAVIIALLVVGLFPFAADLINSLDNVHKIMAFRTKDPSQPRVVPFEALAKIGDFNRPLIGNLGDYLVGLGIILAMGIAVGKCALTRNEKRIVQFMSVGIATILTVYVMYRIGPPADYAPAHSSAYSMAGIGIVLACGTAVIIGRLPIRIRFIVPTAMIALAALLILRSYLAGTLTYPPAIWGIYISAPLKSTLDSLVARRPALVEIDPHLPIHGGAVEFREGPWSIAVGVGNALRRARIDYCSTPYDDNFARLYATTIANYMGGRLCTGNTRAVRVKTFCRDGRLFIDVDEELTDIGAC